MVSFSSYSFDVWKPYKSNDNLTIYLTCVVVWQQDYDNISSAELTEAESLRHQLEWELGLDGRCLESHAWYVTLIDPNSRGNSLKMHFSQLSLFCVRYHGAIPRSHAESLLKNDGEFLIRDSSTGQPGDLVLSTFFGGYLHFMINKVKRMLTKELGEPVVHFNDLT